MKGLGNVLKFGTKSTISAHLQPSPSGSNFEK